MSRKDYILIATAIAQAYREARGAEKEGVEKVLEHMAHALQVDNPAFKTDKFVQYVRRAV